MTARLVAADPFEALGHPVRRQILRLLRPDGLPVHEIAAKLPISRPAVSRHLRLLKNAGLVAERAEGTRRIYTVEAAGLEAARAYLEEVWHDAMARFTLLAANTADDEAR